jgi:ribosomal protein L37AE/L43A
MEVTKFACNRCGNNEFMDVGNGIFKCIRCGMKIETKTESNSVDTTEYFRKSSYGG